MNVDVRPWIVSHRMVYGRPVRGLVCPIRAEGVSIRKHQPVPWPHG